MRPLLECLQFLAYEHMKRGLAALQPLDPHQKRPQKLLISDLTLAATASKVVATMFTYPYQVVRSCMQQRRAVGGDMVHFETFSKTTAHLWRSEGLRAFYRGLFPHLLRSTPQSSITLLAYEYIHRGLHIFH
uniref:ADP/ATP translocase n=1 Tax=Chrysotila carterae TaxID=13221 RepID=A0A7S4EWD5_CHRCT|mmetsp:Transcript_35471/g.68250  ORF Transcript_35471/g.68250 Transcript_35471/m.68250 type:complete len:132 (+) Transcript_35471:1333-1728(+)